ncbi:hypothetical protein [Ruminococcus gauvreauii]|uniref:hypothetical protein n=1 Tax=Ruminococcus gauvreauii TaxID=438033 RepID=UPI00398460F8
MKIVYHIGEKIEKDTIVKEGEILENNKIIYIKSDKETIKINKISSIDLITPGGLGTMIMIRYGYDSIIMAVPRLYLKIGTGILISNLSATVKLKKKLEEYLI